MKTSLKLLLTSILAIAAVAIITMPVRSFADGARGGATQLTVAPLASGAAVANAAMAYPKCKDKTLSYDASSKASVKDIRTVSLHDCGGCSTTINTAGVGKDKVATADHACTMAGSCCN